MFISGSSDTTLKIWDINSGLCVNKLIGHSDSVNCVCVLPDFRIISASDDKTIKTF